MNTRSFLTTWFLASLMLMVLDMLWFSVSVPMFYKPMFERIQHKKWNVRAWSTTSVWVLIGLFITTHIVSCSHQDKTRPNYHMFLYGFIIYGVYNMTNHAVFEDYSLKVAAVDTIWGSLIVGVVGNVLLEYWSS